MVGREFFIVLVDKWLVQECLIVLVDEYLEQKCFYYFSR